MNARNVIIAIVVVAVLGVGGWLVFGGSDDNSTPADNDTTNTSTQNTNNTNENSPEPSSNTNQNAASTDEVEIEDFAYTPATITVKKGTTVTWTNKDSTAHTVTADSGSGLDSELLEKDESYSFTFNETGTFKYHCTPHPNMTGTVIVTE